MLLDARFVLSETLTGGAPADDRRVQFAVPGAATDRGSVTVLCGPNNSGKTFLLRRLREALVGAVCRVANQPTIELTEGRVPRVVFSDRLWRDKTKLGTAGASASAGTPADIPDLKAVTTRLAHRLGAPHLQGALSPTEWEDRKNRSAWFKEHHRGHHRDGLLLRCDAADPVVIEAERSLGGVLYLRIDGEGRVDFALRQAERDVLPFEQWSEGQKSVFAILALVSESNPDVVLIDEIENHFHPGYMSAVLHWLRARVPQTIVVTHHPHVIFSEFVDHVVFLELKRGGPERSAPPHAEAYQKHDHPAAPFWTATTILDDFSRIAQSYRLFDQQDNRLLRQATTIQAAADLGLYAAIVNADCGTVEVSPRPLPDGQTQQIAELLPRDLRTRPELVCLDLGAGLGRVAGELRKLPSPKLPNLRWACWEPDLEARKILRQRLETHPFASAVDLDDIEDGTVDIALLANVVHACTPPAAAQLIAAAANKLRPTTGMLLVSEIYPLLRAERFAVPYSQSSIVDVFNALGYLSTSRSFKVFSRLVENAHCTACRLTPAVASQTREQIALVIEAEWDRILARTIRSYATLGRVRSYADYQTALQDMTTIASIEAYRAGVWL